MDEHEERIEPAPLNRTRLIGGALDVSGGLLVIAALIWAIARFWQIFNADNVAAAEVAATVVLALVGLGTAALFFGAGEAVRKLEDLSELLRGGGEAPGRVELPGRHHDARANDAQSETMSELVGLMREVRDISLLSDDQRQERLSTQADELSRRLQREVPDLLRQHKWFDAFKRVRTARERFPKLEIWEELAQQIQAVRSQVESHDIEETKRQIGELTTLGAWDRASALARDLLERHPRADGAIELARRVKQEREKAEAESRARLMSQAQEYSNRREWPEALAAARAVIQRFPNTEEAEALRQQLPILEANAEVKSRQQLEAKIRDLLTKKRYDEAVRMARELISRYPNSPQAAVLHDQLPRLEEKAAALR